MYQQRVVHIRAQRVESFRRPEDGRPTHRVLASLGALDDEAIANIRLALKANRAGEALVLPARKAAVAKETPTVQANYRYLDLAVLLRLWRLSGLAELRADLLPERQQAVGANQVIASLVLHPLQARLPGVIQRTEGACVRLFIDATDTWIVGSKLPLAAEGKDKEGLYRHRVGIVLLCDQRGFPLRWTTMSGRYHDATALLEIAEAAAKLDWVGDKPVILDRAVGNARAVERLAASGIHYLTALPWIEFDPSGARIPWDKVAALQSASSEKWRTGTRIPRAPRGGTGSCLGSPRRFDSARWPARPTRWVSGSCARSRGCPQPC